jgi:hypothetical protein
MALLATSALAAAAPAPAPAALEVFFSSPQVWDGTPDQLERALKDKGLRWLSDARTRALFGGRGGSLSLFEGKIPLVEATADFTDGTLSSADLIVFSRGDARAATFPSQDAMELAIASYVQALDEHFDKPAEFLGRDASSATRAFTYRWSTENAICLLRYNHSDVGRFLPEFISIQLSPPTAHLSLADLRLAERDAALHEVRRSELPKNIVRTPAADVFIEGIPMVDQGDKGYCAVASAERIFRYYQIAADQHELAQIAASSASGGTSQSAMMDTLKSLERRFKVSFRHLIDYDGKDWDRAISAYNRAAKREPAAREFPSGAYIDLGTFFARAHPETLLASRGLGSNAATLQRHVKTYIDAGIPLLWSVYLGLYPEQGMETPQVAGGHMRLIIGYNDRTEELIFSDSWGAGHEHKRIRLDHAAAMTTNLCVLQPRR